MLLVFGVGLGMHLAGRVAPQQPSPQMGGWSLYVAVIVIAIGLYIYLSAPRGSMLWLILAIGVALVGQKVGGLFLRPPTPVPWRVSGGAVRDARGTAKDFPARDRDDARGVLGVGAGCVELRGLGRAAAGAGDIRRLGSLLPRSSRSLSAR